MPHQNREPIPIVEMPDCPQVFFTKVVKLELIGENILTGLLCVERTCDSGGRVHYGILRFMCSLTCAEQSIKAVQKFTAGATMMLM